MPPIARAEASITYADGRTYRIVFEPRDDQQVTGEIDVNWTVEEDEPGDSNWRQVRQGEPTGSVHLGGPVTSNGWQPVSKLTGLATA
jgi:hypothetical protein